MFLFKNRILATFSGDVLAGNLLTTRPAVLNVRSLGTLVTGMDRQRTSRGLPHQQ